MARRSSSPPTSPASSRRSSNSLREGVLTLKGQRRYEGHGKDEVWLDRSYGAFERSFTLPETADGDHLTADLADGVLTIHVAQRPRPRPKKIAIGINAGASNAAKLDREAESK